MDYLPFSVSMCVYGRDKPAFFKLAVDSILNQTIKPSEVVLVVDGPVPSELDSIISTYEGVDCFNVIRLAQNQGHGNARRTGLENCKYDLVALMDADDISVPDRFEKQLKVFREEISVSVVGGNINEFVDKVENTICARNVPFSDSKIKEYMKYRCPMNQMTVMFKRQDVEAAGGYIDWYCNEDYYLWIRMSMIGATFANINEVLVNVRVGTEMYQRRGGKQYFESEKKLQQYMLKHHIITISQYCINIAIRWFVQRIVPNRVRGYFYRIFARGNFTTSRNCIDI